MAKSIIRAKNIQIGDKIFLGTDKRRGEWLKVTNTYSAKPGYLVVQVRGAYKKEGVVLFGQRRVEVKNAHKPVKITSLR